MAISELKMARMVAEKQEWKLCGAERRAAVISAAVPQVMSRLLRGYVRLWAGYVLLPLAAKLRCAHIFIKMAHSVNWSGNSLPPSRRFYPCHAAPPLPPRRSPLVLRLFALALADGSGLPFSLYPPPAALESQTPQREARALPRRALS